MRYLLILSLLFFSATVSAQDEFVQDQPFSYDYTNEAPAQAVTQDVQADPGQGLQGNPPIQSIEGQEEPVQPEGEMPAVAPIATPPPETAAPIPTYEKKKFAVLQTLDKLTARTASITVPVGQPTAVGPLFVDIKTCQKTPPNEQPESSAFMQMWEAKPKPKLKKRAKESANEPPSQWVFSGWMFASSPALSAMDHPVYDVWLKDCVNTTAASKQK